MSAFTKEELLVYLDEALGEMRAQCGDDKDGRRLVRAFEYIRALVEKTP